MPQLYISNSNRYVGAMESAVVRSMHATTAPLLKLSVSRTSHFQTLQSKIK